MLMLGPPGIIAPPHVPEGEKVEDFGRIVILLRGVIAVGIDGRVGIVQKKGLSVPQEPEVLVFFGLVIPLIKLRHHLHGIVVVGPEGELRRAVAFRAHLLHGAQEQFPFIPVTDAVGNVQDEHVDAGILQHGKVPPHEPGVLAQEITGLRLSPVVGAVLPERMVGVQAGRRVLLQDFGHVRVRAGQVMVPGAVPGNVEDAREMAAVLDRAHSLRQRHLPSQGIRSHPSVAHQVGRVFRFPRRSTGHGP